MKFHRSDLSHNSKWVKIAPDGNVWTNDRMLITVSPRLGDDEGVMIDVTLTEDGLGELFAHPLDIMILYVSKIV